MTICAAALRVGALVVVSLACLASARPARHAYVSTRQRAPAGVIDEDLYAATVRVFTDRGWSLRDKDAVAGMVTTEWVIVDDHADENAFLKNNARTLHAWRAIIDEGVLRLMLDCNRQDNHGRRDCDGPERVESWVQMEPGLRAEIFRVATSRARKRAVPAQPVPASAPASQPSPP